DRNVTGVQTCALPISSPEERQHFFDIINTFRQYEEAMIRRIVKSQNFIDGMIPRHQVKLAPYREHLLKLKMAVSQNYKVITDIKIGRASCRERVEIRA